MLRAASATFFSAASVRSIDAPSGSFTPAIRYSLSWIGMKPRGTHANTRPVASSSTAYTANTRPRCASNPPMRPWYSDELRLKKRLNGWNTQPNARSMKRDSASLGAPCACSNLAASAGESVSELIAEITVEMAMVTANCL
jgi:hypothetical protein